MNAEQLIEIGVIPDNTELIKPTKCWVNAIQDNIVVHMSDTLEDIFEAIYNTGKNRGINEGKRERSREFQALLDDGVGL